MTITAKSMVAMVIFAATAALLGLQEPAVAQEKTVKACQDEWRANRQANQSAGITEKSYVDKCRSGQALNQPSGQAPAPQNASPPASSSRTTGTNASPPASSSRTTGTNASPPPSPSRTTGIGAPSGGNQFSTEAQAKTQCGADTVVWANLQSKVYHFAGSKDFGTTKRGAFMCERQATGEGIRAAKNEKHP